MGLFNLLYVLELDNNCYYVGFTSLNIKLLMKQFKRRANKTPVYVKQSDEFKLIKTIHLPDLTQEEALIYTSAYAVRLMEKVGYKNVRGGIFSLTNPESHRKTVANQVKKGKIPYIENLSYQIEADEEFGYKEIFL